MGRKSQIPQLEAKIGQKIYAYLSEAIKQGKKPPEMAAELDISVSQTYNLIDQCNLKDKLKEAGRIAVGVSGELKDLIDEYLRAKEVAELSSKTIENYRDFLYNFLWWLDYEGKPPTLGSFANPATSEDFQNYLRVTEVRFGGKSSSARRPIKPSSRKAYRRILRAFGYWLVKRDYLEKNPIIKTESIRVEKRLPEDIPDEILLKILNSFDSTFIGIRNKTIIVLFCDTGLRLAGIVGLQMGQIDVETGWAKVIEKGDKERLIRVSPTALQQLNTYIKVREPLARVKHLWITATGDIWERDAIRQFVRTLNQYSTPEHWVHPHAFRHVWAKHLALSDVNPLKAQVMGGWEDIELYQHYARAFSSETAWDNAAAASPITKLLGEGTD